MKRNQFLSVVDCVTKLERATKRKSAIIQLSIPDEVCEKFLKAIIDVRQGRESNIKGLELSWLDTSIKND